MWTTPPLALTRIQTGGWIELVLLWFVPTKDDGIQGGNTTEARWLLRSPPL